MHVMTAQKHPGEPERPAEDPASRGEDLAALLTRLLSETGRDQKELAEKAGIKYPTLNAWLNRTRGTSRIEPDTLRSLYQALKGFGAHVTTRELFEAVGRQVPGPTDQEREAKLLKLYRGLSTEGQRAVIQAAEAMYRASRAS